MKCPFGMRERYDVFEIVKMRSGSSVVQSAAWNSVIGAAGLNR